MSQASQRGWRGLAAGLLLLPIAATVSGPALAQTGTPGKNAPGSPALGLTPGEQARQMVRQARQALQAGDVARARQLAQQAKTTNTSFGSFEDTPDKVLRDADKGTPAAPASGVKPAAFAPAPAGAPAKPAAPAPAAKAEPAKSAGAAKPEDARAWLKQGRELLAAGKPLEAKELALKANAVTSARWGLFEDSPSRLLGDVNRELTRLNQAEADKLLKEARELFAAGKLDEAKQRAMRSEHLHGPYSLWDLGDRPSRLVGEIETAQAKIKSSQLPPPVPGLAEKPAEAVVSKPKAPAAPAVAAKPTPTAPAVAAKPSGPAGAVTPAVAQGPKAGAPASGFVVPAAGDKPTTPTMQTAAVTPTPPPVPSGAAAPLTVNDPKKVQAQMALSEARARQRAGLLPEAYAKAGEVQKMGVTFNPDEDRPEVLMLELSREGVRQIGTLVSEAQARMAQHDLPRAEASLTAARRLAVGLKLDTTAVDEKWRQLAALSAPAVAQAPAPAATPAHAPVAAAPVVLPASGGDAAADDMLRRAGMELRAGNTEAARRLAEEVCKGPFSPAAQERALGMIRSANAEESNQRVLAADRAFEKGRMELRAGNAASALALLKQADPSLLPPHKQGQLKELLQSAQSEARKAELARNVPPARPGVTPAAGPATGGVRPVNLTTSQAPADTYAGQVARMQEVEFQRLREEGLKVQIEARSRFEQGEIDEAVKMLSDYISGLKSSSLEPGKVALLTRPADRRLQEYKLMALQKRPELALNKKNKDFKDRHTREAEAEHQKGEKVQELMRAYRTLMDEGKYPEAIVKAEQAHELDPDSVEVSAAVKIAEVQFNQHKYSELKKRKETLFVDALNESEDPGPTVTHRNPLSIDKETYNLNRNRQPGITTLTKGKTDAERAIEAQLTNPVSINFQGLPLGRVLDELRSLTRLNIVTDLPALEEEGVRLEQPVTLKLDQVPLKSTLNLLLHQCRLTWVIKDNVVQVTTDRHARGRLQQKVYAVADLVIPVENAVMPATANLSEMLRRSANSGPVLQGMGGMPGAPAGGLPGGVAPGGNSTTLTAGGQIPNGTNGGSAVNPFGTTTTTVQGPNRTMEDALIKLVTNTIAPSSWSDVGGPGTIQYYPLGMQLVINQTPDVQEQVQELLESLRRLLDVEVSVEVRLITLAETFFERIGLDLALNIKTDRSTKKIEPTLTGTTPFKPNGFIQDLNTKGVVLGLTPAGTFTNDLDVPIQSSSFQYAIPPFAYPNNPGFNGGLSLGLAFLNDIQVYMFMEAAQGDRRTNVMQAPKLTVFNGANATIQIQDQQFFVTNVQVVSVGGQIVFVPQNQPFPLGVFLSVQPVVSADRRFVRLTLQPQLTNLASAVVPLFPVTSFVTPTFDGGFQGQPIPFTQFVQQPAFTSVTLQTTVNVPDGGTVLLGGLKTLSEGRNEFGPPVVSKVPYLNRLFKNVGYGREAQSLMLMVTPRVIINAEEEIRQTGVGGGDVIPPGAGGNP